MSISKVWEKKYFNPRPPRGGRRYRLYDGSGYQYISIHAPREGGDKLIFVFGKKGSGISIHAPREGGDTAKNTNSTTNQQFQSTPPARGATSVVYSHLDSYHRFQSTPPARGATLLGVWVGLVSRHFNPRPPRGGRPSIRAGDSGPGYFNPRPPRGGRPIGLSPIIHTHDISIHAPREGGDPVNGIYPRFQYRFQSTPPARGATGLS